MIPAFPGLGPHIVFRGGTPMSGKHAAKYKKFDVNLPTGALALYAAPKILDALQEVTTGMKLYEGVRLAQVMKAVYEQGMKDGRKEIIDQMMAIEKDANYLPPGRPRKLRK
jgi:hypothetical protein